MPYLYVRKMKTAASWKENDPILETRKIALLDGKTRGKNHFFSPGPPSCLKCSKMVFFGLFSKMALTIFFIFDMIVEDNGVLNLRQIAIFRTFMEGD